MSYLMSKELGQAVLNYLGTQPYVQVASMVQGMTQMGEIDDAEFSAFLSAKAVKETPEDDGGAEVPYGD